MTTNLMQIAMEVGATVELKKESYGDSIGTSAAAITLLFPAGIPLERYDEVLLIARVWDKLQRAATGDEGLDECPWLDIAGYAIRGAERRRIAKEMKEQWQGSVSDQGAEQSSKAQPDSAAQSARARTTTSERSSAEPATSQPPASSSPQPTGATASTAEAGADPNVADPASQLEIVAALIAALLRITSAARSWHNFHHGSQLVQCDDICAALPDCEAAIALVCVE